MLAKRHEVEMKTTLAVCDKELLGKTFEQGELSFTVSEKFYGGKEITESELAQMLKDADSINLFGNKCVTLAQKYGYVGEKSPIVIAGIKHAQVYRL